MAIISSIPKNVVGFPENHPRVLRYLAEATTLDPTIDPAVAERITIARLVQFCRAWLGMLREGAVPQEVAEACEVHCDWAAFRQ